MRPYRYCTCVIAQISCIVTRLCLLHFVQETLIVMCIALHTVHVLAATTADSDTQE
jgi:hypothetical protein